jgi:hypothetical protein
MSWIDLELAWLVSGHSVLFAPEDGAGIRAFEMSLHDSEIRFVMMHRHDLPAVVFELAPAPAAELALPRAA